MKNALQAEATRIVGLLPTKDPSSQEYQGLLLSMKMLAETWDAIEFYTQDVNAPTNNGVIVDGLDDDELSLKVCAEHLEATMAEVMEVVKEDKIKAAQEVQDAQQVHDVQEVVPVHTLDDLKEILTRCSLANLNIKAMLDEVGAIKLSLAKKEVYDKLYSMAESALALVA